MKSVSAPTFLRALLLAGLSCIGSTSVHAAGTEPSTPVYVTIQPNGTVNTAPGVGQVETATVVAPADVTPAGNLAVSVTSWEVNQGAGATVVNVALDLGDTPSVAAGKIAAALNATAAINPKFLRLRRERMLSLPRLGRRMLTISPSKSPGPTPSGLPQLQIA